MAKTPISEVRRREILEAAYRVFCEKGYHRASMADIAGELEVGHGTLYRYYENKLDIVTSVIDEVITRITDVVADLPPGGVTTLEQYRERLERIGERFFRLLEENPQLHSFLFFEGLSIDDSVTAKINAAFALFASYTEMYLQNGIRHGYLRSDMHTYETSLAINAMLFEAARRLSGTTNISGEVREAWLETVIGLMLEGLAA